ncbi:IS110 family transposase [Pseudoxanthomonas sp. SGD-10]|nr:IS110 family transposase [Pseudoxanthomonas sp. SGD-10]
MKFTYFIGTDVSKNELDFAIVQDGRLLFHKEINNTTKEIVILVKGLLKLPDFELCRAVFCMEHTGIYNNHLLTILHKMGANVCLEAASQIKNSSGNIRGKNDKVDAIRIADYAYRNSDRLRLWTPKREVINKLAHLSALRSRLIQVKKTLTVPLAEDNSFVDKRTVKENLRLCKKSIESIQTDLMRTEKAIDELIQRDPELQRLFRLTTSVSGIGKVVATEILITTNEFKDIREAKKFACYSGVAPFAKESGLFKGKAKVSPMANKNVKKLLHLAALVAIQHNKELKIYFERKVREEKKNKMLVINAVRNKLILRIFACVNNNREYEKNYQKLVA